jgi:hypothetical protein
VVNITKTHLGAWLHLHHRHRRASPPGWRPGWSTRWLGRPISLSPRPQRGTGEECDWRTLVEHSAKASTSALLVSKASTSALLVCASRPWGVLDLSMEAATGSQWARGSKPEPPRRWMTTWGRRPGGGGVRGQRRRQAAPAPLAPAHSRRPTE